MPPLLQPLSILISGKMRSTRNYHHPTPVCYTTFQQKAHVPTIYSAPSPFGPGCQLLQVHHYSMQFSSEEETPPPLPPLESILVDEKAPTSMPTHTPPTLTHIQPEGGGQLVIEKREPDEALFSESMRQLGSSWRRFETRWHPMPSCSQGSINTPLLPLLEKPKQGLRR